MNLLEEILEWCQGGLEVDLRLYWEADLECLQFFIHRWTLPRQSSVLQADNVICFFLCYHLLDPKNIPIWLPRRIPRNPALTNILERGKL